MFNNDIDSGFESINKSIDLYAKLSSENPSVINYKRWHLYNCSVLANLDCSSKIFEDIKSEKDVYTKEDINPLLFKYYFMEADKIKAQQGKPDFSLIKTNLEKAMECALTKEEKLAVSKQIAIINEIIKQYR